MLFVVVWSDVVLVRAGREVVALLLFRLGTPILVGIVEPSDGTLLDWAARTALRLLAGGLALVFGWSVRTEVPAARCSSRAAAVRWTRRKATRTRGAKSTAPRRRATARSRRTEAAGPWTRWSILSGPRFAHGERPSFEGLLVKPSNRLLGDRAVRIVNEREASRPSCLPIGWEYDL